MHYGNFRRDFNLEAVAIHEAGHFVVGYHSDIPIVNLAIQPYDIRNCEEYRDLYCGWVRFAEFWDEYPFRKSEAAGVIAAAGRMAVKECLRFDPNPFSYTGDLSIIEDTASRFHHSVQYYWEKARKEVGHRKLEIITIAKIITEAVKNEGKTTFLPDDLTPGRFPAPF